MRGLYINSQYDKVAGNFESISDLTSRVSFNVFEQFIDLLYDPNEWRNKPVIYTNSDVWVCYGWFVYKNEKNCFQRLINDFKSDGYQCLKNISAGMFVIAQVSNAGITVFTDPLGLSTHYIDRNKNNLTISPSLQCFDNKVEVKIFTDILKKHGSLFGNNTIYKNIERLQPGSITKLDSVIIYYQPNFSSDLPLSEVPHYISKLCSHWPKREKAIAISGGMDSRLILACSDFSFGYTYGPKNTGDRPIARLFANDFNKYSEFSYLAPNKVKDEEAMCEAMFKGSSTWVYRLLSAYVYSQKLAGQAHVFFDGYLGDVLQRGAYLKFSGVLGELFKLFPFLYDLNIYSAEDILVLRYKALNEHERNLLLDDFKRQTQALNTPDEFAKLTYYEFVYGRGGRYIINGGNITCGQVLTVVPVFTELNIFHCFLSQSLIDSAKFRLVSKVWQKVPLKYKVVKTETGFKPTWPALLIPYIHFYNRLKLHFLPGGNYGREIADAKRKGI